MHATRNRTPVSLPKSNTSPFPTATPNVRAYATARAKAGDIA
jgi:hypothetical protein